MVDNRPHGLFPAGSFVQRRLVRAHLAVGTGSAGQNQMQVFHLGYAVQRPGVFAGELQYFLDELLKGNNPPAAEVDEPFIETVTHGAPPVLVEHQAGIHSPALIVGTQAVEHSQDAGSQCRETKRIVNARAHIHDARLKRGIPRAGPQIPPDHGRIGNQARVNQHADVTLVFRITVESLGQSGARHRVEYGQAVRLQAGILALPERRGT